MVIIASAVATHIHYRRLYIYLLLKQDFKFDRKMLVTFQCKMFHAVANWGKKDSLKRHSINQKLTAYIGKSNKLEIEIEDWCKEWFFSRVVVLH